MARTPANLRGDSVLAQSEVEVGSVPVGSWVELYNLDDQLIYRGYVERQSPWGGYTVVVPVTEGDGNFIGQVETWSFDKVYYFGPKKTRMVDHITDGTLARMYSMSDHHYVQEHAPATWLGVDEELATELVSVEERRAGFLPTRKPGTNGDATVISLVPVVSLIPEEVE